MKRRVLAVVAALLLATVGGVMVLFYVSAADQRAMADMEPSTVLVVTRAVPEGATAVQPVEKTRAVDGGARVEILRAIQGG